MSPSFVLTEDQVLLRLLLWRRSQRLHCTFDLMFSLEAMCISVYSLRNVVASYAV